MSDRIINVAVFAGVAALVGGVVAFLVLKAFKVKDPFEHKAFPYMVGGGILIAYIGRAVIR